MYQIKSRTFMRICIFIIVAGTAHSHLLQHSMIQILSKNMTLAARVGDNVMLPCTVSDPDNAVIEWTKNGGNEVTKLFSGTLRQTRDMRYNLNPNNNSITIDNVNLNDSGKFLCELLQENSIRIEHALEVYASSGVETKRPSSPGYNTPTSERNPELAFCCFCCLASKRDHFLAFHFCNTCPKVMYIPLFRTMQTNMYNYHYNY